MSETVDLFLHYDTKALDSALAELQLHPEVDRLVLEGSQRLADFLADPGDGSSLISAHAEALPACGANQQLIVLEPSELFLELLAALRASKLKAGVIQNHESPPSAATGGESMDRAFMTFSPDDPSQLLSWRIQAEAASIIGPENMRRLREAGLVVSADPKALIATLGRQTGFEDPDTGIWCHCLSEEAEAEIEAMAPISSPETEG